MGGKARAKPSTRRSIQTAATARISLADAAVATIALWPAGAIAAESLVARRDQLACGSSLITAHASCYGRTSMCVGETLTFRRPEGSTSIAPNKQQAGYSLPSGGKVLALDYHITE